MAVLPSICHTSEMTHSLWSPENINHSRQSDLNNKYALGLENKEKPGMVPICAQGPWSGPSACMLWGGGLSTQSWVIARIRHLATCLLLGILVPTPYFFLFLLFPFIHLLSLSEIYLQQYYSKAKCSSLYLPIPTINGKRHSILVCKQGDLVYYEAGGWLSFELININPCKQLSLGLEIHFTWHKLGRISNKAKRSRKYGRGAHVWTGTL